MIHDNIMLTLAGTQMFVLLRMKCNMYKVTQMRQQNRLYNEKCCVCQAFVCICSAFVLLYLKTKRLEVVIQDESSRMNQRFRFLI